MDSAPQSECWHDILARRAREPHPWLILPKAPTESDEHHAISYAELFDRACRVAASLVELGVGPAERVVVIADNSAQCCMFVLGVFLAGAAAVPTPPLMLWQRRELWAERLAHLCRACEPRALLVAERKSLDGVALPPAIAIREFSETQRAVSRQALPAASPDRVCLLQYTSGTTSKPRGVELTENNLLHAVRAIGSTVGLRPRDVNVSWLPLFHDMGLIGSLLTATYWRMSTVLMTPQSFGMRPESWLWAISRFGAACSVAPNSAYHLCADRIPERRLQGLDLRTWRTSFNGAELIHASTIDRFTRRFAGSGYRSDAMYPVYGLAENTVAASLPPVGRDPLFDTVDAAALELDGRAVPVTRGDHAARAIVSVGSPLPGQGTRVVDPRTFFEVPDRIVGEIQVRGPCTMRGYFGDESADAFTADSWLRTGDRGYVSQGELYVVGRYKHVIKRAGRTLDCAFIENTLRATPGVPGAAAVFGVASPASGMEELVVMAETTAQTLAARTSLEQAIRSALISAGVDAPDRIELVTPGAIPRTTSGKIRHAEARAQYLARP